MLNLDHHRGFLFTVILETIKITMMPGPNSELVADSWIFMSRVLNANDCI